MSTIHCPACGNDAPAGEFCGSCGVQRSADRGNGWLRTDAYAAAPGERVLRPWLTSSLFPGLPKRSRKAFRAGLILLVPVLIGFAVLRWQAPMVVTAALGLPVLFLIYLRQIGVRRSIGLRNVVLSLVLGLVLGVAWASVAGRIVARAYAAALGAETNAVEVLLFGGAVPISEALLMVVPAAVVWMVDRSSRRMLDGFAIGALGATALTAATTVTLLVPQLAMGVTAPDRSVGSLVIEALVEGVAWPLVGLAAGGIAGIALWFTRSAGVSHRRRWVVPGALLIVLILVGAMGVVDVIPLPSVWYGALHLVNAALAVFVLRIVLAAALVRQKHESVSDSGQLACPECGHEVAVMAFCTDCGVAISAMPRRAASYAGVLGPMAAALAVVVAVGVVVSIRITPTPEIFVCPPDCGRPPLGTPVESNPRFSGDDGAFSVAYPDEGSAYEVTFDPPGVKGVELKYVGGDTGTLTLFGEPADGRTAKQITQQLLESRYPGAAVDYEIPNASVGYQPGFGVIADVFPTGSTATYNRLRVIVMAAVKHDYALIAAAVGPYHQFSPDYGNGHPSGANVELAMDMGKYVNSFKWYGDRYARP